MSIEINTSSHRINRYSDFRLTLSLTKNGDAYVPTSFMMVFYVDDWTDCTGRYTASCLNGEYNNCSVSGTAITVYFNAPGFNLGQLKCRVLDIVEDADFRTNIKKANKAGIMCGAYFFSQALSEAESDSPHPCQA